MSDQLAAEENERLLLDAARRFILADQRLADPNPDPGDVVMSLAARHDMNLLCGAPCGCSDGDCPGLIGSP